MKKHLTEIVLAFALVACSSRPAPSESTGSAYVAHSTGGDDGKGSSSTPVASEEDMEPCVPGFYKTCHITYVDEDGQTQCPADVQYCKPDGKGYYACGSGHHGEIEAGADASSD